MFSFRKPSALIVSGLLLLQMIGTANAATPAATPGAAKPATAPKLVPFTPSAELRAQLAQSRAERVAADALKARQQQQLKRSGTGFVPGDSAPSAAPMYQDDETVRVIITLNGDSAAQKVAASGKQIQSVDPAFVQDAAESTIAARDSVVSAASSAGVSMTVRHTYGVALNGFSVAMRYGDIARLQQVSGVKRVDLAKVYEPTDNFSTRTVGATQLWDRNPSVDGIGQVIAIIDTGVDYRHPELGGQTALDANGKVVGGWNFADDSSQVLDFSGSGHGTHVAGIAAATGAGPEHIKGMAPKAKILAQKVFSNDGDNKSAYTDDLVAAINDAINPSSVHHPGIVANVLNMSLGARSGFADASDPEQQAIANAARAGTVSAISAGNSNYNTSAIYNPYYWNQDIATVGSPGTAPEAITVASSQNGTVTIAGRGLVTRIDGAAYSGGHYTVYLEGSGKFGALQTIGGASLPLAIPSGDEKGCVAADWQGVNLTGKIALIKRGSCTFQSKTDTAANAGARGVVIFNQIADPDLFSMAVDAATIPSVMVLNSFGLDLQAALKAGKQVQAAFNGQEQRLELPDSKGDTMSGFSSWGTTPELGFKPDLTAPGGNIYSSVPNGQYEIMGGTSMAAPHVAGAAALIKQVHPNFTAEDIKAALMNTARVLKPSATANPYSPRKQGAGRIQVDKAIDTNVVVTAGAKHTPGLMLGAVPRHSVTPFSLTVTNRGSAAATFDLSGAVYRPSSDPSGDFNTLGSTLLTGAAVTFAGGASVSVPAGQSVTVSGALDLANAADPATAMYGYFAEGFITLASKTAGQPDLTVPYMSFVGEWIGSNAQPIVDPMADDNLSFNGTTGMYAGNPNYVPTDPNSRKWIGLGYDLSGKFHANDMAFHNQFPAGIPLNPGVSTGLTLMRNAQTMQIDVIDAAGKLVDRLGSELAMRNLAVSDLYVGDYWHWDGKKYDRSTGFRMPVAEGQYRVRVRALSPGGNADRDGDWQTYMMPVKVDNTKPRMNLGADRWPSVPGPLTFSWGDAADNAGGSGLYGIVPILDGKVLSKQWSKPTATGSVIVDIAPGAHSGVGLCVVDNADNMACFQFPPFTANAISAVGSPDLTSNKPAVTLNYTTTPGIVNQVTYQVGAAEEVKAGTSGTLDLNFAKDGKYTVVVRAYADVPATTLVGAITYTVDVDMSPPVVTITKPDVRTAYASGSIAVEGSVTEAHPLAVIGVQYSVDNQGMWYDVAIGTDNKFSFTAEFVGNGRHNLKFRTQDAFGNQGELARVVVVGLGGPTITTALDPGDPVPSPDNIDVRVTHPGDFRLTGATADPANNYSFSIDGMAQYTTDVLDPSVPHKWTYDVTDIGGAQNAIVTLKARDAADQIKSRTITFIPAVTALVHASAAAVTKDPTVQVLGMADASVTGVWVNGVAAVVTPGMPGGCMPGLPGGIPGFPGFPGLPGCIPVPAGPSTFTAQVAVTEGKNAIEVLARTSSATLLGLDLLTVIRDTAAPVIRIADPLNGAFVNGAFTVKGTITDANLAMVTVDGSPVTPEANGEFSYSWSPGPLPDGEAKVVVVATDKASNNATATATFNLDQTAPTLTVSVPSGVRSGTVTVTGVLTDVNPGSVTVKSALATVKVVAADLNTDGTFRAALTFTADGEIPITVVGKDKADNATTWNGTVTIDNSPPQLTITSPAQAANLGSSSVTVAGTVSDAHLATVTVDGQPVTVIAGRFSATRTWTDGIHSVDVVATDVVGNSTTKSVSFNVVTVKPSFTITNLHNGDVVGRTVTVSGDVVQANLAQFTVNGFTADVAGGHWRATVTFATDGEHTVTVVATDVVGNRVEKTVTLVVSTVLKSLTLAPEGAWSPNVGPLKITYELAAAGQISIAVYQSNTLKAVLLNNSSRDKGAHTFNWNGKLGSTVVDGTYEIRITSGNASLSKQTTIDSIAPRLRLGTVPYTTSREIVKIEGVADGAQTVDISVSGPTTVAGKTGVSVAEGGAFVANIALKDRNGRSAAPGTYTFTVTAKDAAGNKASVTVRVKLDNVKPDKPSVSAPAYANGLDPVRLWVRTGEAGTLTITDGTTYGGEFMIQSAAATTILLDLSVLTEGKQTLTASFVDALGNVATRTTTFSIIIDRTAPTLAISPDSPNQGAKGRLYHLLGTVRDDGSGIASVRVNGSLVTLKKVPTDATAFTFDFTGTLSGTVGFQNKFSIVVTDKAGNVWTEVFVVTSN